MNTFPFTITIPLHAYPLNAVGIVDFKEDRYGLALTSMIMFFVNALDIENGLSLGSGRGSIRRILFEQLMTSATNGQPTGYRLWFLVTSNTVNVPNMIQNQINRNNGDTSENNLKNYRNILAQKSHLYIDTIENYMAFLSRVENSTALIELYDDYKNGISGNMLGQNVGGEAVPVMSNIHTITGNNHPGNPYLSFGGDEFQRINFESICAEQRSKSSYIVEEDIQTHRYNIAFPFPQNVIEIDTNQLLPRHIYALQNPFNLVNYVSSSRDKSVAAMCDFLNQNTLTAPDPMDLLASGPNSVQADADAGLSKDAQMALDARISTLMVTSDVMFGDTGEVKEETPVDIAQIMHDSMFIRKLAKKNSEARTMIEKEYKNSTDPDKRKVFPEKIRTFQISAAREFMNIWLDPANKDGKRRTDISTAIYFKQLQERDRANVNPDTSSFLRKHVRFDRNPETTQFFNAFAQRTVKLHFHFKINSAQQLFTLATVGTYARHNNKHALNFNVLIAGEAMASKSFVISLIEQCSVPGTAKCESASSKQANSSGEATDGTRVLWHEMQMEKVMGTGGEKTGDGYFKERLTSCIRIHTRFRLGKDDKGREGNGMTRLKETLLQFVSLKSTKKSLASKDTTVTDVTSSIESLIVATNEPIRALLPISSRFFVFNMHKTGFGDRKLGLNDPTDINKLRETLEQTTDPEFINLRDEYRLEDLYMYLVHMFIFLNIMRPVTMDLFTFMYHVFIERMKSFGPVPDTSRDLERMLMLATNVCIIEAVEKVFYSEISLVRNKMRADIQPGNKLGAFCIEYILLLEPFLIVSREASIYVITMAVSANASDMNERIMQFILTRFSNNYTQFSKPDNRIDKDKMDKLELSFWATRSTREEPTRPPATASKDEMAAYKIALATWRSTSMERDYNYRLIHASEENIVNIVSSEMPEPRPSANEVRGAMAYALKNKVKSFYYNDEGNIARKPSEFFVDDNGVSLAIYDRRDPELTDEFNLLLRVAVNKPVELEGVMEPKETGPYDPHRIDPKAQYVDTRGGRSGAAVTYEDGKKMQTQYQYYIFVPAVQISWQEKIYKSAEAWGITGKYLRGDTDPMYPHIHKVFDFKDTGDESRHKYVQACNPNFRTYTESVILADDGEQRNIDKFAHIKYRHPGVLTRLEDMEKFVYTARCIEMYGVDNPNINEAIWLAERSVFEITYKNKLLEKMMLPDYAEPPSINYPQDILEQSRTAEATARALLSGKFEGSSEWKLKMATFVDSAMLEILKDQACEELKCRIEEAMLNGEDIETMQYKYKETTVDELVEKYIGDIRKRTLNIETEDQLKNEQEILNARIRDIQLRSAPKHTNHKERVKQNLLRIGVSSYEADDVAMEVVRDLNETEDAVNVRPVKRKAVHKVMELGGQDIDYTDWEVVEINAEEEEGVEYDTVYESNIDHRKRSGVTSIPNQLSRKKNKKPMLNVAVASSAAPINDEETQFGIVRSASSNSTRGNSISQIVTDNDSNASSNFLTNSSGIGISRTTSSSTVPGSGLMSPLSGVFKNIHRPNSVGAQTSMRKLVPPSQVVRNVRSGGDAESDDSDITQGQGFVNSEQLGLSKGSSVASTIRRGGVK